MLWCVLLWGASSLDEASTQDRVVRGCHALMRAVSCHAWEDWHAAVQKAAACGLEKFVGKVGRCEATRHISSLVIPRD